MNLLVNWPLGKFLTMHWAGHLVLVRNAFYAVMHATAGANPTPYFAVLLALHAVNVGLVFAIVQTVTRSAPLACLSAAAWGTSPLNEGALGWLSASGNVFVATTMLAVLYDAVRSNRVGFGRAALWGALLLIGAQSFGTGLGIAMVAPVLLVWFVWHRTTLGARVMLLGIPIATTLMYGADYHEFTGNLTSSVGAKASMLFHLYTIGVAGLLQGLAHEPSPAEYLAPAVFGKDVPRDALSPVAYTAGVLVACVWLIGAWRATGQTRRLLVALLVLILANYAVIAVGRSYFVEGFRQPVVMQAAQSRYHYSAAALLAVGLAVVLASVFQKRLDGWPRIALVAWLAASAVFYARSGWVISHHDGERERAERILARVDTTIRETPAGEPVVTYNEPFLDAPIAGGAALYVMSRDVERPVYFVDKAAPNIYRAFPGSRLADAMVPVPSMPLACGPWFSLESGVR
jgi:hypothetical protein